MIDKQQIRTHMRRFRALASRTVNPHLTFLHVYLGMPLGHIASSTGISRKTATRILMGQRPTIRQLRKLRSVCLTATVELESMLTYEERGRHGMYFHQIIHSLTHMGRSLGRTPPQAAKDNK